MLDYQNVYGQRELTWRIILSTGHHELPYLILDNLRIFWCAAYVYISSEDRSKLDPMSKKCVFVGYTKGVKGFKLWDPIKKKMVIGRVFVFNKQLMLKRLAATNISAFEAKTFGKQVIRVDVDPSLVKNMQVVHEPYEKLDSDTKDNHGHEV